MSTKLQLNLAYLLNFVAVVERGSVSKAAMHLNIAQPALSRQIQALEAEFNAKLLRRQKWGVEATEDGKLVVLSLSEQKEARRVDAHAAAIFGIAISHAGDKIATAAGDGTIKVFSWPKLDPIATLSRGKDAVWCIAFSEDDSQLISGGADRRIQLWDLAKQKSVMSLQTTSDWITSLVALPGTNAVAASSMSGKVFVVDYKTMLPVTHTDAMKSAIWSMTLSPNGTQVALGSRKSGAKVLPIAEWIAAAKQAAESEAAKEVAPSPKK